MTYHKLMTQFVDRRLEAPEDLRLLSWEFRKQKTEARLEIEELEQLGVFDPNRYSRPELLEKCYDFLFRHDFLKF